MESKQVKDRRMIRVAYPMRVDALDKSGGDVLLMRDYIRCCGDAAASRGITFEGSILTELNPDLSGFDVVHLTNVDRPFDLYPQFEAARMAGKPTVLTPLHHSYAEIVRYERHGRGGLVGLISGLIGFNFLEPLRILVKSKRYPELRSAIPKIVWKGIRTVQSRVLREVDVVLVAADKELADIEREICALPRDRVVSMRNGFEMPKIKGLMMAEEREFDISVIGRIESRKNQIAILAALESLGLSGIFVGYENPNHGRYCDGFKKMIAKSKSRYLGGVPFSEVNGILAKSRVHVAASWFEVSSRLDIEAYVLGCRVVASACGGTSELLGDDAYYVDPASRESIAQKISAALKSSRAREVNSIDLSNGALETWSRIGERLLDTYQDLSKKVIT